MAAARRVLQLPEKVRGKDPKDALEAERNKRERAEKAKKLATYHGPGLSGAPAFIMLFAVLLLSSRCWRGLRFA
jgi:hypothetical protein